MDTLSEEEFDEDLETAAEEAGEEEALAFAAVTTEAIEEVTTEVLEPPSVGGSSSSDDDVDAAVISVAVVAAVLGLAGAIAGAYAYQLRFKREPAAEKADVPNPMRIKFKPKEPDVEVGVEMTDFPETPRNTSPEFAEENPAADRLRETPSCVDEIAARARQKRASVHAAKHRASVAMAPAVEASAPPDEDYVAVAAPAVEPAPEEYLAEESAAGDPADESADATEEAADEA
mmetsp:Transcript_28971/g.86493  ORF Transcript_28971/g.86493 Transcript_28971/m.86493 type:complete len:232 (+) Transcript_28971:169-864(+)